MDFQPAIDSMHRHVALVRLQIAMVTAAALFVFLFASEVLASVFNVKFITQNFSLSERLLLSFKPVVVLLYFLCTALIIIIVLKTLRPLFEYVSEGRQYEQARTASIRLPVWICTITLLFWVGGVTAYYLMYSFDTPGGISYGWVLHQKLSAGIMCALCISLFVKVKLFRIKQQLAIITIQEGESDFFARNTTVCTSLSVVYFMAVNISYIAYFFAQVDADAGIGLPLVPALIIVSVLLAALSFGVSLLSTRSVHTQLKQITRQLGELSTGEADLTRRMVLYNFDQIGELVAGFNGYMDRMQQDFQMLKRTAENVEAVSSQLSQASVAMLAGTRTQDEGAREILSTVQAFASSMQDMLRDSDSHRQVIQDHARSGEEQMAGIRCLTDQAGVLLVKGREGVQQSDSGAGIIEQVIEASGGLNRALSDISASIHRTDELAGKIGGLLSTIEGISQQTNLIAVNASIEAAHAGVYGKGFAILAGEVRKLSSMTGEAVQQIASLMDQIQTGIQQTNQVAIDADAKARANRELSGHSRDALKTIRVVLEHNMQSLEEIQSSNVELQRRAEGFENDIHRIAGLADQIVERTNTQNEGAQRISGSISAMQQANQSTVDSSRQVNEIAGQLSELGARLGGLVQGFITEDEPR